MTPPRAALLQPAGHRPLAPAVIVLALVAFAFVAAAVASEAWASRIDREADQVETNALPSVEALAAARDALWHLEIGALEYVDAAPSVRADAAGAMNAARGSLQRALDAEFATDPYPGELDFQQDVEDKLSSLDRLLARVVADVALDASAARLSLRSDGRRSFDQVDEALHRLMSLNAREGHGEVTRITRARRISSRLSFALNGACVLFAGFAGTSAFRTMQRRRDLEAAHEQLLAARSEELERFASRVAHDLLSPLSALYFTLSSVRRSAEKGLPVADGVERAEACLKRARSLVEGVMDFARSGAAPGPARASLRESLDGVLAEARYESADVELSAVGIDGETWVACASGILTSILSNLVRNALKYMGDRAEKRVMVRAERCDGRVHIEVEDTGPGLPPGLEKRVFDEYVRGPDNVTQGLGLGLATVKRFVTGHGGRVGVRLSPDRGCVFWFELPLSLDPSAGAAPPGEPAATGLHARP